MCHFSITPSLYLESIGRMKATDAGAPTNEDEEWTPGVPRACTHVSFDTKEPHDICQPENSTENIFSILQPNG